MCAGALGTMFALSAQPAFAQTETYEPGIWVDPDGCQHWVMDDGFEGYMTPNVTALARRIDRSRLYASDARLSVCPTIVNDLAL